MNRILVLISTLLCLGACVPGHNDFSEVKDIAPYGWRYSDVVTFNPTHKDSISEADLCLLIRHNSTYPYSNLWLEVEYAEYNNAPHRDTINVIIADKYGRWKGYGNATDFQLTDTIAKAIKHKSGAPVKIRHIMRVDTLIGIDMVGLGLKESHNE